MDTTPIIGRCARALILLVCAAASLPAQNWTLGVKGGVGQGGFTGGQEFDWHRTVPTTSLFLNRQMAQWLALQPEITYVRKVGNSDLPGSSLTMAADYLQFPVLLQLQLPSGAGFMPHLIGGPVVGVKLRCTLTFVGGGVESEDDCDTERGVQSNVVDYGLSGGLGISRWFGGALVQIEGRYSAGLRTFVVPLDQRNSKSYGWAVTTGVSFPLRPIARPGRVPTAPGIPPLRAEPMLLPALEQARLVGPVSHLEPNWRQRVTVNAVDVDARTLILAIAKEAGVSVVVSSDVKARVSLTATNVLAIEAIQSIIDVAGLSIVTATQPARPTIVFYQPPLDVNSASVDAIAARFLVSTEMAKLMWRPALRQLRERRSTVTADPSLRCPAVSSGQARCSG